MWNSPSGLVQDGASTYVLQRHRALLNAVFQSAVANWASFCGENSPAQRSPLMGEKFNFLFSPKISSTKNSATQQLLSSGIVLNSLKFMECVDSADLSRRKQPHWLAWRFDTVLAPVTYCQAAGKTCAFCFNAMWCHWKWKHHYFSVCGKCTSVFENMLERQLASFSHLQLMTDICRNFLCFLAICHDKGIQWRSAEKIHVS